MAEKTYDRIYSINDLKKHLGKPGETLLVFDVDYTLTHPNEPAFQYANFKRYAEYIQGKFKEMGPKERDLFSNLMVFHVAGNDLIEPQTPTLFHELEREGYSLIALTASLTTTLNDESLVKKRIENLREVGIDFSTFFPNFTEKKFEHLSLNFGSHPHYSHGILFTNGENRQNYKGELLVQFLASVKRDFKRIIFLDDRVQNLQVVHSALQFHNPNVDYVGLHFLGALKYPSKEVTFEEFKEKIDTAARNAQELSESSYKTLEE